MTDAKNITITSYYDKASRPTKRTYSDNTPEVNYYYDGKGLPQVPDFSRGALTKVTSSVSEDRFTEFDNHGRLLASQQVTDGNAYNFEYKYNISGGLLEAKYPSGRIIRNFLDNDGGLNLVTTKAGNSSQIKQVASNFDYSATGSVKKMKLGNGLWETAQVNERYQLTQVGLGTTNANNNLFKIDYEYGELNADGTTVDAGKNIGMIAKTTTTIPGTTFSQTFKYDAINRLTEAKEFNPTTPTVNNWKQTFGYDRFGNRTNFSQTIGTQTLALTNINHPTIDQANNRFTTGQGYQYDFNGNLIQDAEGRTFTFDGNDKQIEVKETNASPSDPKIGRYFYDASGARVKKVTQLETTVFVYDAGGALAAEYSTQTAPTNPTTSYMTTDHLGSPRVITDKNGNVISRRDFMPFGEELNAGVGGRSESQKYASYGSDNVRKRFTGYEKDDETQLDFAEARMYQNKHGRFTAVDPLMASASPINPQTFNRYVYTGNNPINYTDPSGLTWCGVRGSNGWKSIEWNGEVGAACGAGEVAMDEKSAVSNINQMVGGKYAQTGDLVKFYANGKVDIIRNPTQAQVAQAQSTLVGNTNNKVHTGNASSHASAVLPEPMKPIPSLSGNGNGSGQAESGNEGNSEQTELDISISLHDGIKSLPLAGGVFVAGSAAAVADGPADAVPGIIISGGVAIIILASNIVRIQSRRRDDGDILYRGVTNGHPGYENALIGTAIPRGGTASPQDHNEWDDTRSIYTSWTRSYEWAKYYANRNPGGGVILTAKIPKSRQVKSPDVYREQEVLVTGIVTGASVTKIP
jgi:RHS repeat-associated protein